MAFDTDRDSCACGQVVLVQVLVEGGLEVVEGGLIHGPIVCMRQAPRD